MQLRRNNKGFTLVELILATAVFSIALIAITAALIQLFKAYQSGISIRKTQNSARVVSEELTRMARSSSAIDGSNSSLCFFTTTSLNVSDPSGAVRDIYSGAIYFTAGDNLIKVVDNEIAFPAGTINCDAADFSGTQTKITDDEVLVLRFNGSASTKNMMDIDMRIVTENAIAANEIDPDANDDNVADDPQCFLGYEYCSMTSISKSIMTRNN